MREGASPPRARCIRWCAKEKRGPSKLSQQVTRPPAEQLAKNEITSSHHPIQRCSSASIDDVSARKKRKDSASMRISWESSDYITLTLQNPSRVRPTLLPLPPQMDSLRNQRRSGNEKPFHHRTMRTARTRIASPLRMMKRTRGTVTTGRILF